MAQLNKIDLERITDDFLELLSEPSKESNPFRQMKELRGKIEKMIVYSFEVGVKRAKEEITLIKSN